MDTNVQTLINLGWSEYEAVLFIRQELRRLDCEGE